MAPISQKTLPLRNEMSKEVLHLTFIWKKKSPILSPFATIMSLTGRGEGIWPGLGHGICVKKYIDRHMHPCEFMCCEELGRLEESFQTFYKLMETYVSLSESTKVRP